MFKGNIYTHKTHIYKVHSVVIMAVLFIHCKLDLRFTIFIKKTPRYANSNSYDPVKAHGLNTHHCLNSLYFNYNNDLWYTTNILATIWIWSFYNDNISSTCIKH